MGWKYSWILTVKNLSADDLKLKAKIEFQDKEGFVLEDDIKYNLHLKAYEEKKIHGL